MDRPDLKVVYDPYDNNIMSLLAGSKVLAEPGRHIDSPLVVQGANRARRRKGPEPLGRAQDRKVDPKIPEPGFPAGPRTKG
jgi:hypothetical protein